jgi:hypothetical protein
MTAKQRSEVVRMLSQGARLRDAAAMVRTPFADFSDEWGRGKADSEHGREGELATWYRDCQAARHTCIATERALASATAGSRESSDHLRVVEMLEGDPEPDAVEESRANPVELWEPETRAALRDVLRVRAGTGGMREQGLKNLRRGYAEEAQLREA